ncbi:AAA family ATPase [Massilia sp. S19_KUP03_FR1]|uniref:AAA family ATPase n=1 Tax=Massilia sp. S19_KUP03_FR1 TaxID=3025503 RepID=UPI002FCDB3B0
MTHAAESRYDAPGDGKVVLNQHQLKTLRKQLGLSQDGLAQLCMASKLCVSIASIKRAETGKSVLYRTASHLARIYRTGLDELLLAPLAAQPGHAAALPADVEQRSVLALQLVLDGTLTPEQTGAVRATFEQFGGVAQGDDSAIFGMPRAYGSDAVRCLQCALHVADRLQGEPAALVVRPRQWPQTAEDDAVSPRGLLPRGRSGAAPVPVYVERTLGAELGERFVFEPTGYAGDVWRVSHERHGLRTATYPLIGRMVEVQQFKATLETTLAYQYGHILYLRGVAGIGKSRLLQEFIEIARQNAVVAHVAMVLDFGVRGDATPLGQLVRSLLGLPDGPLQEAQLSEQVAACRLPMDACMHLRAILGMPQPFEAATVFGAMAHAARAAAQIDAVRELILRCAVERPQLIVLEDIHWSSPELIALLVALMPDVQDAPVIWLLSSRFENDPLEHTLRPYLNGLPVTMLDLCTLRAQDALQMARHAIDADPQFHALCVARAQGNPLFLTQLLLAGPSAALPGTLKNLVQAKLDLLAPEQRRGVRVAAAIGQYFSLSFLRAVLQAPEHTVFDCVRQFIVRPLDRDNYAFVHDLVMQGIYEAIPPGQRDEIHVALAASYASIDPQLQARHLYKAHHPDAAAALLAAIDAQMAAHQYAQALDLLELVQRIADQPVDAYRVQLASGRCHAKMGQTQRAKAAFSAALDLAQGQQQRVAAVIGLATALNVLEDLVAEEALIDDALAAARAAGVDDGLAELYYLKGNIYFPAGNFTRARQLHELSQRHAQQPDTAARALSGIGDSYYAQGRIVTAHGYFRDCLALCEAHGLADIEASNRFMLGTARIYLNETEGALTDALASAELGRKVGNRRAEIVSRLTAGWALLSLGRVAQARQQVELGLATTGAIGASRFEPFLNESMVRVLLLEGQGDAAYALALASWDAVERNKLHKFIGPWVLSTLALVEPDAAAGVARLAQAQALLDQGCVAHNAYRYYVNAIESGLLHGRVDTVLALADRFAASVALEASPWATHHIALARAGAMWLTEPTAAPALRTMVAQGEALGLAWVMPLWRARLASLLALS